MDALIVDLYRMSEEGSHKVLSRVVSSDEATFHVSGKVQTI